MSKKLWYFAVLLVLTVGFIFSLGYYTGRARGLAEITEIVLNDKLKEQNRIEKMLMGNEP